MMRYETFSEISHMPLRVFNRTVYYFNLQRDKGVERAREYLELFSDWEIKQMFIMNEGIKKFGHKDMRRQVTEGMEFEYDVRYEDWNEQVEQKRLHPGQPAEG